MTGRRRGRRRGVALPLILLVAGLAGGGCGRGAGDDLSEAQILAKLDGHHLNEEQVADRLALADLLCGFDERVLRRIWAGLDAGQLEFQDYVFGVRCPERLGTYRAVRADLGLVPDDQRLVLVVPEGIGVAPRRPASRPDWPGSPPTTTTDGATAVPDDG